MFNAGGVYGELSAELGFSNDEQKKQQFFSQLQKLNVGYDQYDSTVVDFVKRASDVVVKAWSDCMASTTAGVHASLKFTGDPHDLLLQLKYQPINEKAPTANVRIDAPANVTCSLPSHNAAVSVSVVGSTVRCTRTKGTPGAIVLTSDTTIFPDSTLQFPAAFIYTDRTGKSYATCDTIEEVKNGKNALGEAERLPDSSDDIGGGKSSTSLALEAPVGYQLTNVAPHCQRLDCNNPCAFVRGNDPGNVQWTIPNRRAETHPSTNSCRVTVWLSGTKQKVVVGIDRVKNPIGLTLNYGKSFSVEFPSNALDAKLYCNASGNQRIFSLSDVQTQGDQIYLRAVRPSSTGQIMDLAVLPFDRDDP
jgi:hypothetical protein